MDLYHVLNRGIDERKLFFWMDIPVAFYSYFNINNYMDIPEDKAERKKEKKIK